MRPRWPGPGGVVEAPLLTEEEVTALVRAAPPEGTAPTGRGPRRGRSGEYGAGAPGAGLDFADLRSYAPGDDPRHIDWRATARAGETRVRSYHADVNRPLCLLLDRRPAMAFGTRRRLKVTQAARAALWLAGRAMRGGRELAGAIIDEPCRWLPAATGAAAVERLAGFATAPRPPAGDDAAGPPWERILAGLRGRLPAGAGLVMLSDFRDLDASHQTILVSVARHCDTAAIQIVDRAERALPAAGVVELVWGGSRLTVDSDGPAGSLEAAFAARTTALASLFARAGIDHRLLDGDEEDLAPVLGTVAP